MNSYRCFPLLLSASLNIHEADFQYSSYREKISVFQMMLWSCLEHLQQRSVNPENGILSSSQRQVKKHYHYIELALEILCFFIEECYDQKHILVSVDELNEDKMFKDCDSQILLCYHMPWILPFYSICTILALIVSRKLICYRR